MTTFPRLLLLLALGATLFGLESTPDAQSITATAVEICGFGDRSPGSAGARKTAEYLEQELRKLSTEVFVQDTPIIVPVNKTSRLLVSGVADPLPVVPHLPNGMAMAGTGEQTLRGPLVFVGDGSIESLGGRNLTGAIAVIDGVSGRHWMNCARLGAVAVIFRQPETIDALALEGQYLMASYPFPRFVADVPSEYAGHEATLSSLVVPETVTAKTIVARIKGTGIIKPYDGRRETVILSSGYESGGLLRGWDPAATRAWNAALLVQIARQFAAAPPQRDLLIVFHGARSEMFRGLRQLCGIHADYRKYRDIELGKGEKDLAWSFSETTDKTRIHSVIKELEQDLDQARLIKTSFLAYLERCASTDPASPPSDQDLNRLIGELGRSAAAGQDAQVTSDNDAEKIDQPLIRGVQVLGGLVLLIAALLIFKAHRRKPLTRKSQLGLAGAWLLILVWTVMSGTKTTLEKPTYDIDSLKKIAYQFIADQAAKQADALRIELLTKRHAQGELDQSSPEKQTLEVACDALDQEVQLWRNIQQKLGKAPLVGAESTRLPGLIRTLVAADDGAQSLMGRHQETLEERLDGFRSSWSLWTALDDAHLVHAVDLDLSDGNRWFAGFVGKFFVKWSKNLVHFRDQLEQLARKFNHSAPPADHIPLNQYVFEGEVKSFELPIDYLIAADKVNYHVNTISLCTINDERQRLGSPQDTFDRFRSDNFLAQTHGLTALLQGYVNAPVTGSDHAAGGFMYNVGHSSPTVTIESPSEGSSTGRQGHAFPLILIQHTLDSGHMTGSTTGVANDHIYYRFVRDMRFLETHWGNAFGRARIPYVYARNNRYGGRESRILIGYCGYDAVGNITHVPAALGSRTSKLAKNKPYWELRNEKVDDVLLLAFEGIPGVVFDVFDPRILSNLTKLKVFNAYRDSLPNYLYYEMDDGTAAYFTPASPETPLRILASEGDIGNRFTLLGTPTDASLKEFTGLPPRGVICPSTPVFQAEDMWQRNEFNFRTLRKNGVNPESLLNLHSSAERHLLQALDSYRQGQIAEAEAEAMSSWALSERVYQPLKNTAKDVVYGLVIMLIFSIPFALILERLFIAGNTIFKKVGGFLGFFVVTFLFFYFLHPAFSLANNSIIIFLSFIIISSSVLVIGILLNRFEHEMELIRMAGLGLHKVDVNRLGTLLATLTLGISNMRRRPLRTLLTAMTVVLMTFILLTFSSFNSAAGFRETTINHRPAYDGILFKMHGWRQIRDKTYHLIQSMMADRFDLFPRYWLDNVSGKEMFFIDRPDGIPLEVEGMLGVEFDDPSGVEGALQQPGRETTGFNGEADWIFLPPRMIEQAKITAGETILVYGTALKVGTVDCERLNALTHISGEAFTPLQNVTLSVELQDQLSRQGETISGGEDMEISFSFSHLVADAVVVLHGSVLSRMYGSIRSIAMIPRDESVSIKDAAQDLASKIFSHFVYADGGAVRDVVGIDQLAVAGLLDVLIPLILGGLIIFSTMLGSVAERGQEIFIYASLGLAPIHIGVLFLVEATIYSILGGMGGYILAQAVGSTLGFMASYGWLAQPDLNFSSLTAVITILLVMATVLVSALYPAWVASKSANPGDDHGFRIPKPDGDHLAIPFPFTVARRDVIGLLAYLRHYIQSHTEASIGCFTSADCEMSTAEGAYAVTAKTWLAPFDLGISQIFRMEARVTDVKAIYSVHIALELLSGQRGSWRNVLGPFLQELRQQFLVWRTLDDETRDRYKALGGDPEALARVEAMRRLREDERTRQEVLDKALKERRNDELKARAGDAEAIARLKATEESVAIDEDDPTDERHDVDAAGEKS